MALILSFAAAPGGIAAGLRLAGLAADQGRRTDIGEVARRPAGSSPASRCLPRAPGP